MRKKLINLQLWLETEQGNPETDIEAAWKILSRLGTPCRYAGCGADGSLECLITEAGSGKVLAVGRGTTLPMAICQAAVQVKKSAGKNLPAH